MWSIQPFWVALVSIILVERITKLLLDLFVEFQPNQQKPVKVEVIVPNRTRTMITIGIKHDDEDGHDDNCHDHER